MILRTRPGVTVSVKEKHDDGSVTGMVDGAEITIPAEIAAVAFTEITDAGVYAYQTGCCGSPVLDVDLTALLAHIHDGKGLAEVANMMLPGDPDRFIAVSTAADELVTRQLIERRPGTGGWIVL